MNRKTLWLSGLLVLALAPWTQAIADGYFIRLKDANGGLISGVTANFSYNKGAILIPNQGTCVDGGAIPGTNITLPAGALTPGQPALLFNVGVPSVLLCRTESLKAISGQNVPVGTRQCLDNGVNVAGLSLSLTTKAGDYRITFNSSPLPTPTSPLEFVLRSNGCGVDDEPTYNRTYTVTGPNGFSETRSYQVVNQVHANPEPGSLALIFAGLGGISLLWLSRRRSATQR